MRQIGSGYSHDGHPFTWWEAVFGVLSFIVLYLGVMKVFLMAAEAITSYFKG